MKKIIRLMFFPGLLAAALFVSNSAYAEESYQFEVGAHYHTSEETDGPEVDVASVGATIHFSPVNTAGHPLAEAAFLERIGSVTVQAGEGDIKADFGGTDFDGDVTRDVAEVEFMQPGLPIVINATVGRQEVDLNSPGEGDMETEIFNVGFGYFIGDGLRLGLSYGQEEEDIDITVPAIGPPTTTDYDDYAVEVKWVKSLPGGMAFNLDGSIGIREYDVDIWDDGSNMIVDLSGDYYFTESFSLGAGVMLNSGDDESEEGGTVALNLTNFFTPRYSISVDIKYFNAADSDDGQDEKGGDILFSARF